MSLSCTIRPKALGGKEERARSLRPRLGRHEGSSRSPPERPGLSAGGGAAQTGRERRTPEAVSRPRTRLSRLLRLRQVGAAQPPASGPNRSFSAPTVWPPPHLTSFILTKISVRECTKHDNRGPPDRSMNGRKRLLPGRRRKERAERGDCTARCERTAETPRPRWVALPSGCEERHSGPWWLEV